jgi:hypothetical protein
MKYNFFIFHSNYKILLNKTKQYGNLHRKIFTHSEWIKIGHFKTTDVKPSVYYRYINRDINRGFYSCICPIELNNKVSFKDLQLLYWFHNLDKSIESKLHRQLKLLFILQFIYNDYHGILNMPTIHDYNHPVKWCNDLQNLYTKNIL